MDGAVRRPPSRARFAFVHPPPTTSTRLWIAPTPRAADDSPAALIVSVRRASPQTLEHRFPPWRPRRRDVLDGDARHSGIRRTIHAGGGGARAVCRHRPAHGVWLCETAGAGVNHQTTRVTPWNISAVCIAAETRPTWIICSTDGRESRRGGRCL